MKIFPSLAALFLLCCWMGYGQVPANQATENQSPKNQTSEKPVSRNQLSNNKPVRKASAPTTKFFVLSIGSAFNLPECLKRVEPPTYMPGEPHWCWKDPSGIPKSGTQAPVDEDVLIHYPPDDAPYYSISAGLSAKIENGKLQSLSFHTNGLRAIADITGALTSLYGPPTKTDQVKAENNVGDQFQSANELWQFTDLSIDYRGVDGDLSLGTVWIETPKAYKARTSLPKKKENPLK